MAAFQMRFRASRTCTDNGRHPSLQLKHITTEVMYGRRVQQEFCGTVFVHIEKKISCKYSGPSQQR